MPAFGWRKTYLALGIMICLVVILCTLLLKTPEADQAAETKDSENDVSTRDMLKTSSFWKGLICLQWEAPVSP